MKFYISLLLIFGLLTLSGFAVLNNGDDYVAYAAPGDFVPYVVSINLVNDTAIELEMNEPVFDNDGITITDFTVTSGSLQFVTALNITENIITLKLFNTVVNYPDLIVLDYNPSSTNLARITNADGDPLTRQVSIPNPTRTCPTETDTIRECIFITDARDIPLTLLDIRNITRTGLPGDTFGALAGITLDADGNIYLSDSHNNRILKFDSLGGFVRQIGMSGSDGNPGEFLGTGGVAVNSTGHLFVVDGNNNRVQVFNPDGTFKSQITRSFGIAYDVEIGLGDKIYVSDHFRERIYIFNPDGTFNSEFGAAGAGDGQFRDAQGLAVNSTGHVYVADTNGHRIQIFDSDGNYLSQFGGTTSPRYITIDAKGNVYVTETSTHHIRVFDGAGNPIGQFGMESSDTGEFNNPRGVVVDSANRLYVADSSNGRIGIFAISIPYVTIQTDVVGSTDLDLIPFTVMFNKIVRGFDADDITHSSGTVQNFSYNHHLQSIVDGANGTTFVFPYDIAINSTGFIFVTDNAADNVQILDSDLRPVGKFGEEGTGDGQFDGIAYIAIDSNDNVYVSDQNNDRVLKFSNTGTYLDQIGMSGPGGGADGGGEFANPSGIAINSTDFIYVSDQLNHRVQIFDGDGTYQGQFGSEGTNDGQFDNPTGIAIDSDGNVHVSDSKNNRIQVFYSNGTYKGQFGNGGAGGGAGAGELSTPQGIVLDSDGNVYVVDNFNHRIQIFDKYGVFQIQYGKIPLGMADGDFSTPRGITMDSDGNVYVADAGRARIQQFAPRPSYTFDIVGPTDQGTLTVGIPANAAVDGDNSGNSPSNVISIGIDLVPTTVSFAYRATDTSVVLQMSRPVYGSNIPAANFAITDVSSNPTVTAVDIVDGTNVVTLTLSAAITVDDAAPKVSYTAPSLPSSPSQIVDAAGNPVETFTNFAINSLISVSLETSVTGPTNDGVIPFTVRFSGMPSGFDAADISNTLGTVTDLTASGMPFTYTFNVSGLVNSGTLDVTIPSNAVLDAGGNGNPDASNTVSVDIDVTVPTVSTASTDVAMSTTSVILEMTELVFGNNIVLADFTISGAATNPTVSAVDISGNIIILTLSDVIQESDVAPTVSYMPSANLISDDAGNALAMFSAQSITNNLDNTAPTVTLASVASSTSVVLTISESVSGTGITPGDFGITSVATAPTVSFVVVSGTTITLTLSGEIPEGDLTLSYTADVNNSITDISSNTLASFSGVGIARPPVVTLSTVGDISSPTNLDTIPFIAQFSKNITGFEIADITISSGTVQNFIKTNNIISAYSFEVAAPTTQETLTVSIQADAVQSDDDDNMTGNPASNVVSLYIDTIPPTVTSIATSTSTSTITLETSKPLFEATNIPVTDFVISGNDIVPTVTTVSIQDTAITLTLSNPVSTAIDTFVLTFSPTDSSISITDLAGNSLAPFSESPVDTPVVVSLTTVVTSPTTLDTIPFVAQFSEDVTGFDATDITNSSGTIQNFVMIDSPIKTIASANSQNFVFPRDVELDSAGNFYVTDTNNERIIVFDDDGTYLREIAIDGNPLGITLNSTDHIFVSDRDDRILIYNNSGTFIKEFGDRFGGGIRFNFRSNSLAVDANDNLYVAVDGRDHIQIFDSDGTFLREFGSFGSNNTEFRSPTDVALDSDGKIYVVDTNNHRIQVFYNNGTYLRQFGSEGSNDNQFDAPSGIAIGTDGRIYISDTGNNRIQVFDSQDNHLATFTSPTLTFDRTFMGPTGIAVDARGNLYVAEPSSNLFRIFPSVPALVPILEHAYTFDVVNPNKAETLTVGIPATAAQSVASGNDTAASNVVSIDFVRTTSGGGGGSSSGESTPPSLTTSFDDGFESIVIDGVGISPAKFKTSYQQNTPISVGTAGVTPIQITLHDNLSWGHISHIELCINKPVTNNQICDSDTKITWDQNQADGNNSLEITDPHNLITDGSTSVRLTEVNANVATFDFDIQFAGAMDVSDLQIYAWDTSRNALAFTIENAFEIVLGASSDSNSNTGSSSNSNSNSNTGGGGNSNSNSNTGSSSNSNNNNNNGSSSSSSNTGTTTPPANTGTDDSTTTPQTSTRNDDTSSSSIPLDREILKRWTGFTNESISDAEFLTHVGISEKRNSSVSQEDLVLPNWTKNMVGKWALEGKISTDELKATLSYMYKLSNDEK